MLDKVNSSSAPSVLQFVPYNGSDCSSGEGMERTLVSSITPVFILVEGAILHPNEYTLVGTTITFHIYITDAFRIGVYG